MNDRILRSIGLTAGAGLAALMVIGAPSEAEAQNACVSAVQGKIAWDYKGSKKWAQGNLQRLCRGANDREPAKCFRRVMHGKVNWGGGTQWKWENAIDLCEGSRDANRTVSCFKRNLQGNNWKAAIAACDERAPQLSTCEGALQGQVAWNYKGSKRWAKQNVDRLCRNSSHSDQPAKCFQRIMHGNVNWGGGTKWKWENAVDLCEQSKDANRTVSCFRENLRGGNWKAAIAACDERAPARAGRRSCKDALQGRVAWDYKGSKRWNPANLRRLCAGAGDDEPAKCFAKVMHGNVSWGGSTQWKWQNAIDLCEQSKDADRTVRCFERKIRKGRGWKQAIERCDERRRGRGRGGRR